MALLKNILAFNWCWLLTLFPDKIPELIIRFSFLVWRHFLFLRDKPRHRLAGRPRKSWFPCPGYELPSVQQIPIIINSAFFHVDLQGIDIKIFEIHSEYP